MTDAKDENKLIAERRSKLDALREGGNAYPNDFHRNALAAQLHQTFEAHEDVSLREEHVAVPRAPFGSSASARDSGGGVAVPL